MRTLSEAARISAYAQETDKVWSLLLTIAHPSIDPPIRVVNDTVDLESRGNTFVGFPFELSALPPDTPDEVPEIELRIDNVDRAIIDAVRAMQGAATVTIEVVVADSPDTVEAGPMVMTMRRVSAPPGSPVIAATLSFEDILSEPFPAVTFNPATHPGLF